MTPWTAAWQVPLPRGFSRQEYWSGLPYPPLGDLLVPRIEPRSPTLQAIFYCLNSREAHTKSWLIEKDPYAGKDWRREEKGTTEDEMVGWHHGCSEHEFEWTPGVGDGQRNLACCNVYSHKESETTERSNWTELNWSPPPVPGLSVGLTEASIVNALWTDFSFCQFYFCVFFVYVFL